MARRPDSLPEMVSSRRTGHGPEILASVSGVSKSFPGVVALRDVDFDVRSGEVNALVGENGAGKSTLIKLMAGLHAPDQGDIVVGEQQLVASPTWAHQAGIATIHQDHNLVSGMSVAENIVLGRWPSRFGIISKPAMLERSCEALALVAPELSPHTLARRLSPAERQLVEVARALSEKSRILILDEPTTSLSGREIDRLFDVIENLKLQGLGIVFVSHWLEEVFRIADRITVLRDGRLVGTAPAAELNQARVIQMMVGREVRETVVAERFIGDPVLEVRGLTRDGAISDVTLSVRKGEIVTLAGLVGAGRSDLANCIFGISGYDAGQVMINGKRLPQRDINAAIAMGVALIPEDRRGQGLVGQLSVAENITLALFDHIAANGIISFPAEDRIVEDARKSLSIRMSSSKSQVSTLSGGNQQKAIVARWLARNPQLLILDEPTKGIDVGAKAEIGQIIVDLAEEGVAILLISSELPEVMSFSDRVLIMRSGRIVGELDRTEKSPESIMHYATTG